VRMISRGEKGGEGFCEKKESPFARKGVDNSKTWGEDSHLPWCGSTGRRESNSIICRKKGDGIMMRKKSVLHPFRGYEGGEKKKSNSDGQRNRTSLQ